MKWASRLWGIPHLLIDYLKGDPMHILYVHGVLNKTIACLLYRMCIERKDLPGKTIDARVEKAWEVVTQHYLPHLPPIKRFTVQTFRPSKSDGLKGISFNAKGKETWDLWPGIYHLVQTKNTSASEKNMAFHLNGINEMMKLHNLDSGAKEKWLKAEVNFITLYLSCGFPATPKFHMLQHIYQQFQNDCAPRYSYCFAEESKNCRMAELAKKACNKSMLAETVLLMHELWAAHDCISVTKIKKRRLAHKSEPAKPSKENEKALDHVSIATASESED